MYRDKDGRIFHHHDFWEDYKNGLFKKRKTIQDNVQKSFDILSDTQKTDHWFSRLSEWKYSSELNLSNKSINRQAWIGQAACCMAHGSNEDETKIAWYKLTPEEQSRANAIADYYIVKFERENNQNAENRIKEKRSNRCTRTHNMDF